MDTLRRDNAGVARLDLEGTLFRAALLCGYGARARDLAKRMASVCQAGTGRSCVEAGTPLQITVEAPGEAILRTGLRLGERFDKALLGSLVPLAEAAEFERISRLLPRAEHLSLGYWLFWSEQSRSLFADLRDPDPGYALERLRPLLSEPEQWRVKAIFAAAEGGRPWGLSIELIERERPRLHLYWFASNPAVARGLIETFRPGGWVQVVDVLSGLLSLPGQSGRWLLAIPLDPRDGDSPLWVGNSAWGLVPEDERKHRAIGKIMSRFSGPRDYAEALWSFCGGAASSGWRIGRTCEIGLGRGEPRARLLLTPEIQCGTAAGISSSEADDSSAGPAMALPFEE